MDLFNHLMMTNLLMMTMLLSVFITPMINNLMFLGATLLMTALLTTVTMAKAFNSWFAFILFLIYITGLLVLFGYMLAMSPNNYKKKIFKMKFMTAILFLLMTYTIKVLNLPKPSKNFEWEVIAIYNEMNILFYWTVVMILLVALVMVVSLCFKSPTPLRPFL